MISSLNAMGEFFIGQNASISANVGHFDSLPPLINTQLSFQTDNLFESAEEVAFECSKSKKEVASE